MPALTTRSAPSSPSKPRHVSTTAPRHFPPKNAATPEPPQKPVEPAHEEHVTSTGPSVVSQRTEAAKVTPVAPEQVTVAPGLPATRGQHSGSAEKFTVKMPVQRAELETEQVIVSCLDPTRRTSSDGHFQPFTPDNYRSNQSLPSAPTKTPEESSMPKVITVASASTHPAGGPTHSIHGQPTENPTPEPSSQDPAASLPSLGAATSNVFSAPGRAWKASGFSLPAVGMPKNNGGGEYKRPERGMNDEEKRGLWVLGGVVGLGLLLGGPGRSRKNGKGQHGHDSGKGKQEGKGVKGDAQWEKASGAGLVGHGARKE